MKGCCLEAGCGFARHAAAAPCVWPGGAQWLVSCTVCLPAYCSRISRSFLVVFLRRSESNSTDPVFITGWDGQKASRNGENWLRARCRAQGAKTRHGAQHSRECPAKFPVFVRL